MKNQWTVGKAGMEARQVRILQKHWHRAPLFGAAVSLVRRCQCNDPLAIARDGYQADVRGRTFVAVLCDEIARATQFEGEVGSPKNQRVTHESFGSVPHTNVCTVWWSAPRCWAWSSNVTSARNSGGIRGRLKLNRRPPARAPLLVGGLLGGRLVRRKVLRCRHLRADIP